MSPASYRAAPPRVGNRNLMRVIAITKIEVITGSEIN